MLFRKELVILGSTCQFYSKKFRRCKTILLTSQIFRFVSDEVNLSTLFKTMKIFEVKNVLKLEVAKFMHFYCHSMLPKNFYNYTLPICEQTSWLQNEINCFRKIFIWNGRNFEFYNDLVCMLMTTQENQENVKTVFIQGRLESIAWKRLFDVLFALQEVTWITYYFTITISIHISIFNIIF